jgi:hypothetical protein
MLRIVNDSADGTDHRSEGKAQGKEWREQRDSNERHVVSKTLRIQSSWKKDQAMEIFGGARVDCDARSFAAGVLVRDSAMRVSTLGAMTDADDCGGWAHRDIVAARQQS